MHIKIDFTVDELGSEISLVTDHGAFRIPYCSAKINIENNEIATCMLEVEIKELVANIPIDECNYTIVKRDENNA